MAERPAPADDRDGDPVSGVVDFGTASIDELIVWISSHAGAWDVSLCRAIRDRAATSLGAAPQDSDRLARTLARRALTSATTPTAARAFVHRARAEACLFTGQLGQADVNYRKAVQAARRAGDAGHVGQILVGWINVLSARGNVREARAAAGEAEHALRRVGDTVYLAKLYVTVGNTAYHQEDYQEALSSYQNAERAFLDADLRDPAWVSLLVNLGVASTHTGDLDDAERYLRRAESEAVAMQLTHLAGQARFNRSHVDRLRGDYRGTLDDLREAESILSKTEAVDLIAALRLTRSEVFLELGMAADAAREAAAARDQFQEAGMELDAELARLPLARAFARLGDPVASRETMEPALAYFRRQRLWPRLALGRLLLSDAQAKEGDIDAARRTASRALTAFERRGMAQGTARARRRIAELDLRRGRGASAEKIIQRALRSARKLRPGDRAALFDLGGRIAASRRDRRCASSRFARALAAVEEQQQLIPGAAYRAHAFEEHASIYRHAIDFDLAAPSLDPSQIWTRTESARARGLRERRRGSGRNASELEQAKGRLRSLTGHLDHLQIAAADTARIQDTEREVTELEQRIAHDLRESDAAEVGDRRRSLGEVAADLRPDEAVISYFVGSSSIVALIVTDRGSRLARLPITPDALRADLDRVTHHLEAMSTRANGASVNIAFMRRSTDHALRRLYDEILGPLVDELDPDVSRLYLAPHGVLHRVPFECLTSGESYLNDRFDIARIPSGSWIGDDRNRVDGTSRCAIAGTITDGPAAVSAELDAIANALPRARVLRDPMAGDVLQLLRTVDLLHLSAHGTFRGDNPVFSRIATNDGGLFMADLIDVDTAASLVVLSACNSGSVFTGNGDDLSGVAHALLGAGARQLVASHWRVHDEATRDLMIAFYDALASEDGTDPIRALRTARTHIRARWDHPYYWGAFAVHGT